MKILILSLIKSTLEIFLAVNALFFLRWLYFRIREYQILHPYDGSSFWQIVKDNLDLPGARGR